VTVSPFHTQRVPIRCHLCGRHELRTVAYATRHPHTARCTRCDELARLDADRARARRGTRVDVGNARSRRGRRCHVCEGMSWCRGCGEPYEAEPPVTLADIFEQPRECRRVEP
jgi:hypothetical protein